MKFLKNTYLGRMYKTDRLLFVVFVLYVVGILYYAARQREEFPFLLYGMYSLKENAQQEYITYSISINGNEINYNDLPDAKKELMTVPLANALAAQQKFEVDVSAMAKLQAWLYDYSGGSKQGGKMIITKLICKYGEDGKPVIITKEPIAIYGSN